MPTINVASRFALQFEAGRLMHFEPGEHEVPQDVADHPYTKAHLVQDELAAEVTEAVAAEVAADAQGEATDESQDGKAKRGPGRPSKQAA